MVLRGSFMAKGEVSGSLSERIHSQSDINILSKWVEYAAMCQSIEEFEDRVSRA